MKAESLPVLGFVVIALCSKVLAGSADTAWRYPFWVAPPEGAPGATAVFRKTFTLDAKPKRCFVTVTATDLSDYRSGGKGIVFVNGQKVGELSEGNERLWTHPRWFDATTAAGVGGNVVAVQLEVKPKGKEGAAAMNFEGDVWLEDGQRVLWRSDSSWRCLPSVPSDANWRGKGFDDSPWPLAREIGRKWGKPRALSGGTNALPASLDKIGADAESQLRKMLDLQLKQSELNLVPRPHQLTLLQGEMELPEAGKPLVRVAPASDKASEEQTAVWLCRLLGLFGPASWVQPLDKQDAGAIPQLVLASGEVTSPWAAALLKQKGVDLSRLPAEGYAIVPYEEKGGRGFLLAGKDDTGLLYAVYTFIQLLRKDGDRLLARRASIVDYPDMPVRGLIGYDWMDDLNWLSFYRFNRVFVITNIADPIDPEFTKFIALSRLLAIEPVFYIHPAADFCFSNPAHMQLLFDQMEAAEKAGFKEITLQCDDFPTEPTLQDAEVYGAGKLGLARAHVPFVKAAHEKAKALGLRLYFCPLAYSPFGWPEQDEYLRIVSDIPLDVDMFTTTREVEWQKKLKRPWPQFWSNELLDRTYTGINWFSEYPQVPKEQAGLLKGAWVMTHAFGVNRANTLCYVNNWWNLAAPLPFKSALEREWGAESAKHLLRYAEAIGFKTQWNPEMNIYSGWKPEPSEATLRNSRERAKAAAQAKDMGWTGSGLEGHAAALRNSARKIELIYTLFADWTERKLAKSGAMPTSAERTAELGKSIDSTLAELKKLGMGDYVLSKLRQKWE